MSKKTSNNKIETHQTRVWNTSVSTKDETVEFFNFSVKLCVKEKVFNSRIHNNNI